MLFLSTFLCVAESDRLKDREQEPGASQLVWGVNVPTSGIVRRGSLRPGGANPDVTSLPHWNRLSGSGF